MVRRALVLALVMAGAVLGMVVLAAPHDDQPVAVVGHTGVSVTPSTTLPVPPAVRAVSPPTPTTAANTGVVANRSSTVVQGGGTVTVTNEGSAVASTGGNTVIGPHDASVTNGPVSAVGNSAEVRVSRP